MKLVLALALAILAGAARAEDRPGDFEFYVLALSWSPAFCAIEENRKGSPQECGTERDFIVHGLWPQRESDWPEFCGEAAWVPEETIRELADLMPSRRLVLNQWRKHGSCTGLAPRDYFAALRRAQERVRVPAEFANAGPARMSSSEVERAFASANPGLKPDMMAVRCKNGVFAEMRICMTPELGFRSCRDVDRRGCDAASLEIPAR